MNNPLRHLFQASILICIICLIYGCRSLHYSRIINSSQAVAFNNYVHAVSEWMDIYSTEREYYQIQNLLECTIEQITKGKTTDTIFVFETYSPMSRVYCMYLWNNTKTCCIIHTFDTFFVDTTSTIDYRLKELITEWDTNEIIRVSHLKVRNYYQKYPLFDCATRLVLRYKKHVDAETIIFREVDLDTDTYPTFFD